jgi:tetratricopeptide (TPR) repeat protein
MKNSLKYFLFVLSLYTYTRIYSQSQRAIDSLTILINKAPEDSNKVNLIFNLGRQYDLYKSKEHITHFMTALKLAKKIGFNNGIRRTSVTLINYLFYKEMYDVSLSFCLEYIAFLEREGLNEDKFKIYNILGSLYVKQGEFDKAYTYYSLAKNYFLERNDMIRYANVLTNINILHVAKKEYDSALFYSLRALEIYKRNNSSSYMANSLLGIAEIHLKNKDFEGGKKRLLESLPIYQTINEKHGICNCYFVLGQLYSLNNNNDSALKYFNIALAYSDTIKMDFIKKDCYQNLATTYYALNNYKAAYDHHLLYKKYSDSISFDNVKGKMLEMEVKYDITKKEGQLKEQEYELLAKSKQRNYLILIVGVILVLFFISFRAYNQKKKANSIISEQKKLVDDKQKEIIDSINYASRIQKALLPSDKYIDKNINKLKP